MEILFISHKYPPMTGGMEKQSFELVSGMEFKTRVHKLCYTGNESKILFFINLKRRTKRILKENPGISVIHFNDGVMALFSLWLKRYSHAKLVATFHGLDVVFPNRIYQQKLFPKFNLLDKLICVSRYTAHACITRGIESGKVVVINNGIDQRISEMRSGDNARTLLLDKLNFQEGDKKIILSIGRAVKRKGFSWFLNNVLPGLSEDCIYVMVGPTGRRKGLRKYFYSFLPKRLRKDIDLFLGWPNDTEDIINLLSDSRIGSRAVHLGQLPYDQLMALLEMAYIFVMPNIKENGDAEGFGLVALEAALKSKCVLASDLDGIVDSVHDGKNGILLESHNKNTWISAINNLIRKPEYCRDFGKRACEYSNKKFSWEKMTAEYYELFLGLHNVGHTEQIGQSLF